jgi:uncharacterized membrane protein
MLSLALRWLHVLSAITWIGGMLFIALVLVPVTRRLPDPALRTGLVQETGRRFRAVAWIALALLIATGALNLWLRPYLLAASRFQWKLALVGLTLALSVAHDFVLGPRAGASGASPSLRTRASWVARANLLVALAIVLLGLALRG